MSDEQPEIEAPKPAPKPKPAKDKHAQAKADAKKRIEEVAARTPVYAKQVGPVMVVDKRIVGKDRSGQAKAMSERSEMGLAEFHAKYEPVPGSPNYYTPKG